jgi:hypothetical protein
MSVWTKIRTKAMLFFAAVTLAVYWIGVWFTSSLSTATRLKQCRLEIGFDQAPPSSVPAKLSVDHFPVSSVCTWRGYERVEVTTPVVNSLVLGLLIILAITAVLAVCSRFFGKRGRSASENPGISTGSGVTG